jgi:hypothetical protein
MRTRSQLTVIDDALEAIELLRPLVKRIKALDKSLAEQICRAASSVVLNLGEAAYSDPGNPARSALHCQWIGERSAAWSQDRCPAWGYIDWSEASRPDEKLDAVLAKTYRWLHPKKS